MTYTINSTMNIFKNKTILILGLGRYPQGSGVSAVRYLNAKGAKLIVSDMKTKAQLADQLASLKKLKNIRYILGTHEGIKLHEIDLIVKNPGVRADHALILQAMAMKIPIHSDITLFMESVENPIIAITGTRGKSTTTTLIHQLIQKKYKGAQIGGNIKISPLSYISKLKNDQPVVLELSSWQLNSLPTIKRAPLIAVVTNIMVDHLNMYPSFNDYLADKKLIFKYQTVNDLLVLNKDNKFTKSMAKVAEAQICWFSLKPLAAKECGAFLAKNGDLFFTDGKKKEKIINRREVKLLGEHNLSNILAAIIVAKACGIKNPQIKSAIKQFKGIDSRLEMIKEIKGVKFYNDTTATTPDATIAAIRSFSKAPILIVGGTDKELEFDELAKVINSKIKKMVFLPGTATEKLKKKIKSQGKKMLEAKSMRKAVDMAKSLAKFGDIILLSPGAASFGLFQNEFDRGDQFNKEVSRA